MKNEITLTKEDFEKIMCKVSTDFAAEIAEATDFAEGLKASLIGASITREAVKALFKEETLEVEK